MVGDTPFHGVNADHSAPRALEAPLPEHDAVLIEEPAIADMPVEPEEPSPEPEDPIFEPMVARAEETAPVVEIDSEPPAVEEAPAGGFSALGVSIFALVALGIGYMLFRGGQNFVKAENRARHAEIKVEAEEIKEEVEELTDEELDDLLKPPK